MQNKNKNTTIDSLLQKDEKYIIRPYFSLIQDNLNENNTLLIHGSIAIGKTFTLKFIANLLNEVFQIPGERIIFLDCKQQNDLRYLWQIIENNSPNKTYILCDNIDYLEDYNLLEKTFNKHKSLIKLIATYTKNVDSSISSDKNTKHIFIDPLSFEEILNHNNIYIPSGKYNIEELKNISGEKKILELFNSYLIYGGYPQVVNTNDVTLKKQLLKSIVEQIPNPPLMEIKQTLDYFALNISELLNICDLGSYVGVSRYKAEKNLAEIEDLKMISFIPSLDTKIKKSLVKSYKIVYHDTGVRNKLLNIFNDLDHRNDVTKLYQNFLNLYLYNSKHTKELSFFRTTNQTEINIILESNNGIIPIQASYTKSQNKTPRIFKNFQENFEKDLAYMVVITKDIIKTEIIDNIPIYFIPAHLSVFWNKL